MHLEQWEDFPRFCLVINDDRAVLFKKGDSLKPEILQERFLQEGESIVQMRLKLIQNYVSSQLTINSLELGQYFLDQGDYDSYKKVRRLESENPRLLHKFIKTKLAFFGDTFLRGFIAFYHQKLIKATTLYEKELRIMGEKNLSNNKFNTFIAHTEEGVLCKVSPPLSDFSVAKAELEFFKKQLK
ncbi:hypothetical protein [Streptococcus dentiloxodontae]